MPKELSYAAMQQPHLHTVAEIAKTAPDAWSYETLQRIISSENHRCFVALYGADVIGFACFLVVSDTTDLQLVAVAQNMRKQGVASKLLRNCFEELKKETVQQCLLEVRVSNTSAIALYKSLAFKRLALRKGMYANPTEDGILMAIKFN